MSNNNKTAIILLGQRCPLAQIALLHKAFHGIDIILVSKQEIEAPQTKVIINNTGNEGFSLGLALKETERPNIIVLDGSYLYSENALLSFLLPNFVLLDKQKQVKTSVGARTSGDRIKKVESFGFGTWTRFARAFSISGQELSILKRESQKETKKRFFIFELLNNVIDQGGSFKAIMADKDSIQ